jgi:adenylosuccinate lyase
LCATVSTVRLRRSSRARRATALCIGARVHAEPTTFGLKLAVWAFVIEGRSRVARARGPACGRLSGAVGQYAAIDPVGASPASAWDWTA